MKKLKGLLSVVLILSLTLSMLLPGSVSATGKKEFYDNFVILGDSLCVGFNTRDANLVEGSTFDIEQNATGARWPHAYPTVYGNMINLDTNLEDDQKTDIANFGVCAAWSKDIYEMITDPFYLYPYYNVNYDKDTKFTLPEDYTGTRLKVDTSAEGYDVTNPGTWEYLSQTETEEYSIPAGTTISVAYEFDNIYYGTKTLILNPVIVEKYYFTARNCYDENGKLTDTNGDGKINDNDYIYYPGHSEMGYSVCDATEEQINATGEPVANPKYTKYYYDLMTDKIKNGDLIAIATGGNDVYQNFMPYQMETGTLLGDTLGMLSIALMLGMSVDTIVGAMSMLDSDVVPLSVSNDSSDSNNGGIPNTNAGNISLINPEDIAKVLRHYSSDSINEYFVDFIADYKENLEKTILRVKELQQGKSELILMGHFNPFGIENYMQMMALKLQDGSLAKDASSDMAVSLALLKAIYGNSNDYSKFKNMPKAQLREMSNEASNEVTDLISILENNKNLSPEEITKLLVDLTYPLSVLVVGSGLSDLYTQMNAIVQEMAEKYDLVCVDISDAPTSGSYDPHPLEMGHKWIAERLYEATVPAITASVSSTGTGHGMITNAGETRMRLRKTQEYRFIPSHNSYVSAIYIDGQLLDRKEYADVYISGRYVFKNVKESHTITVQFDDQIVSKPKFNVNVLGSYEQKNIGSGLYGTHAPVTVHAGKKDGYEFVKWVAIGIKLSQKDAINPNLCFKMPGNHVSLKAIWRPICKDNKECNNTLTFKTNGGTEIEPITLPEGSVVDLSSYVPTKEGYEFAGWYLNSNLTQKINSISLYNNATVYAKWNKIKTNNSKYHITAFILPTSTGLGTISSLGTTIVGHNETMTYQILPSALSSIGAIFIDGKYLDPLTNSEVYSSGKYVFKDIDKNHTISVQFEFSPPVQKRYSVNVIDGYSIFGSGEGLYRPGSIVKLHAGEREGYKFIGWETDDVVLKDASAKDICFKMPENDVTVVAKWAPLYNLTFVTNGGTEIESLVRIKGSLIDLALYTTTKDNETFAGWYYDEALTKPVEFDQFKLEGNTTLYAKWSKVSTPAVNSEPEKPQVSDTPANVPQSPKTGDSTRFNVWAVIAILSSVLLLATVFVNKKVSDK